MMSCLADKSLAGFLVESFRNPHHGEDFHLLGFGININNNCFPDILENSAISLSRILGGPVNLHDFTLSFLAKMAWNIGLLAYAEQQELERGSDCNEESHLLIEQWKKLSDTVGRRVVYGYDIQQKPLYEARVIGIRPDGALVMQLADGHEIIEHSGELQYL